MYGICFLNMRSTIPLSVLKFLFGKVILQILIENILYNTPTQKHTEE